MFKVLEEQILEISHTEKLIFLKICEEAMGCEREEFVGYATINTTNNGAKTYHKTLKSRIKTHRPNIWTFLGCLEEILCDFDLEYERLEQGLEISCPGKKLHKEHTIKRNIYKEKLAHCTYSPKEHWRRSRSGRSGFWPDRRTTKATF